jgi:hypothetical protein
MNIITFIEEVHKMPPFFLNKNEKILKEVGGVSYGMQRGPTASRQQDCYVFLTNERLVFCSEGKEKSIGNPIFELKLDDIVAITSTEFSYKPFSLAFLVPAISLSVRNQGRIENLVIVFYDLALRYSASFYESASKGESPRKNERDEWITVIKQLKS